MAGSGMTPVLTGTRVRNRRLDRGLRQAEVARRDEEGVEEELERHEEHVGAVHRQRGEREVAPQLGRVSGPLGDGGVVRVDDEPDDDGDQHAHRQVELEQHLVRHEGGRGGLACLGMKVASSPSVEIAIRLAK